jgi:hypothetical protein
MNLTTLATELTNDPLARGYSGMTAAQAAASLNTANRPSATTVLIPSAELLAWSGGGASDDPAVKCRYERIQEAAGSHASNVVRGACLAALGMIERDDTGLDLSKSDRVGMLDALVSGGVLTAGEKTEVVAMGTPLISRAQELGLGTIGDGHVKSARGE